VHRWRIVESGERRAGSTGRPIVRVIGSIPVRMVRQRNRPDERERKNNPTALPCTPMYGCSKNAEFVRKNPAPWRARNAFPAAQCQPHIISSQVDPIGLAYIRSTSKTWSDYPPHSSDDDFVPLFTYLQRDRFAELTTWAGKRCDASDANEAGEHARCVFSLRPRRSRHHHLMPPASGSLLHAAQRPRLAVWRADVLVTRFRLDPHARSATP
jgi:hypothetical protein